MSAAAHTKGPRTTTALRLPDELAVRINTYAYLAEPHASRNDAIVHLIEVGLDRCIGPVREG